MRIATKESVYLQGRFPRFPEVSLWLPKTATRLVSLGSPLRGVPHQGNLPARVASAVNSLVVCCYGAVAYACVRSSWNRLHNMKRSHVTHKEFICRGSRSC